MSRRIAILIDGGFFLKRLPRLVAAKRCGTPEAVTNMMRLMCRNHVKTLTDTDGKRWLDHVYRIFFYDALPYDGVGHHPLENRQIDFGKSDTALFRRELFECLRRQRKVALRLGKVNRESDWAPPGDKTRRILGSKAWFAGLALNAVPEGGDLVLSPEQVAQARTLARRWAEIEPHEVRLGLRQKGVDMRIGLDIASITLKQQADTIVLIAGDSDFVPAAKLARREGREFILDPLWQQVNADLFEHIDGLQSGLPRPKPRPAPAPAAANIAAPEDN
jgi:uncharacterized LabA/DUF88 family protein